MDSYVFTVFSLCVLTVSLIKVSVLGQCSSNKFGPDCRYDCHCKPEVICDPVSGCPGKCGEGWDGPTCQRQNVALNRPASQNPCYEPASNAVDGMITPGNYKSCASTSISSPIPSPSVWNVTLDQEYSIRKLIIYLRTDCCRDRMNGFTVSVGQTSKPNNNYRLCYKDNTTSSSGPDPVIQIQCSSPLRGDVVRIRTQKTTPLTLCEVNIPVCAPGSWGEDCGKTCGRCYNNNVCSEVNGHCPVIGRNPRCMAGYKEAKCLTNCISGTYGPDCNSTCGFCAEGESSCNIVSGNCPVHNQTTCYSGYRGIRCDSVCIDGTWGPDCKNTCGQCQKNMVCNTSTGVCPVTNNSPRCSAGYRTESCSVVYRGSLVYIVPMSTTPENNLSGSDNTGIIVGGAVGALVVVGLTVLGIVFILAKYRREPKEPSNSDRNRELDHVSEYVNGSSTENKNITAETNQSEETQYETMDNHEYGDIRHSAIGEESKYTSLTLRAF